MNKKEGYYYMRERELSEVTEQYYKFYKDILRIDSLTAIEKFLLCIVKSFTDNHQEFRISNNRLGYEMGISYSSVSRVVSILEKKGLIKVYRNIDVSKSYNQLRVIELVEEEINKLK